MLVLGIVLTYRVKILDHAVFKGEVLVAAEHKGQDSPNHAGHTTNETKNQVNRVDGPLGFKGQP